MSSEERLDRLELIAMLMPRAGLRVRRDQNEKINIIIDSQIKNEDRFAQNEERFVKLAEAQAQTDARFNRLIEAQTQTDERLGKLAEAQERTDERLNTLIDIVRRDRNGNSG
jgi:hypothetical protein